jgi:chromate transporter
VTTDHSIGSLAQVARYFLRLGFVGFGGPAAHIAFMRRDLVQQKRWLTDAEFVDLLGVTNLIPGPNSTEMTMYIGGMRSGWKGLWLGGLCFMGPAVGIVLALAWAYKRWGTTPAGEALAWGIQPIVLAIIVQAIWGLRKTAIKGPWTLMVSVSAAALSLAGVNDILVLLAAGLIPLGASQFRRAMGSLHTAIAFAPFAAASGDRPLGELFLAFLKIGGLLYGSGYVLFAFLEDEFVTRRGWLTGQQLVDAIAVGQFTPGPLFSSATFVGYLAAGWRGAAVATIGIFLPSFLFVAASRPLLPRLRGSRLLVPFLDGVNAAAIALMAVVTLKIGGDVIDSPAGIGLLAGAGVLIASFRLNTAWLVLAGACVGLVRVWLA